MVNKLRLRYVAIVAVVVATGLLSSCSTNSTLGYYRQSIVGHTSLMLARKPIDKVLRSADEKLAQRLQRAIAIRRFASDSLGLPDNNSYTSYVQLKTDLPIWNVVAAEEFSLRAKQWCYPVVGCASYRGYYHKADAQSYATLMQQRGYETTLAGATAYSTLGWFADPLTSAMFRRGDAALAELIFHELAHQQLYVKNDSRFNEAFASTVGEQGAITWLTMTGQQDLLKRYLRELKVREDFLQLLQNTKSQLQQVYQSDKSLPEKRKLKQQLFVQLQQQYQQLKADKWNNHGWYDGWFKQPLNNARFVAIATYRDLVPSFVQLFERCGGDFSRFYRAVAVQAKTDDKNLNVACLANANE